MNNDTFQIETPAANQPRKKGWGCIWISAGIGCVTMLLLACGGIMLIIFSGLALFLTASEPFQQAVRSANDNAEVRQLIGDNIQGTPVSGSINETNGQGSVEIEMTVEGSKGKGKIHVRGSKSNGTWNYDKMTFTDDGGNQIDLNPAENKP